MYINRELEETVTPFMKRREAIAIIGPRQCGKTTLLKHIADDLTRSEKKVRFLTFEKRSDLALFDESIEDFRKLIARDQAVIIDEFQYARDGGQKLKYLYDTTEIKFIVSGSSSLELTFQTGKYMVGRMLDFTLLPFSFREFLSHHDKDMHTLLTENVGHASLFSFNPISGFASEVNTRLAHALERYALFGGYPAVVLAESVEEKQKLLEGIVDKYISRDIRELLRLTTDDALVRLARLLSAQAGSIINYSELSSSVGISTRDIRSHISILEKTFIISLTRPFFRNKRTELVKNPKVYLRDCGVRNYLLNDFREVKVRLDAGALMENYAFGMLAHRLPQKQLRYWRTKSKAEVDFVVEEKQNIVPIEVKYASVPRLGKSYHSFLHSFSPAQGIILTKDTLATETVGKTKITLVPLSYF